MRSSIFLVVVKSFSTMNWYQIDYTLKHEILGEKLPPSCDFLSDIIHKKIIVSIVSLKASRHSITSQDFFSLLRTIVSNDFMGVGRK